MQQFSDGGEDHLKLDKKAEKPSGLQLSFVNARQSTTSTITSDYFSMNSREADGTRKNREEEANIDNRYLNVSYHVRLVKSSFQATRLPGRCKRFADR